MGTRRTGASVAYLVAISAAVLSVGLSVFVVRGEIEWPSTAHAQSSFYPISLRSIANNWLQGDYANPPIGDVTLGDVPFHIPTDCCQVWVSNGDGNCTNLPQDATLPAVADGVTSVHLLLNTANTDTSLAGLKVGEVVLDFDNGASQTTNIIVGGNVREWSIGTSGLVRTASDPATQEVWRGYRSDGVTTAVIDMLTIPVSSPLIGERLRQIRFVDTSLIDAATANPCLWLVGITLDSDVAISPDFNAANDFSATNNPSGVWSYGWTETRGSAFNLATNRFTLAGLDGWDNGSSVATPGVLHNGTASAVTLYGTLTVPAGGLLMHPGPIGENAVVRWTAPAAGTYEITGEFTGLDFVYPTTTDVAILAGSNEFFSGSISSFNVPLSFSVSRPVLAGETIDFTVGYGVDGNYVGDSTGLDVTISPRPALIDADGDGVPDAQDACPTQPEDPDGFQDLDGCPDPDNDGDGVLDGLDMCPDTLIGATVDERGCSEGQYEVLVSNRLAPVLWAANDDYQPKEVQIMLDEPTRPNCTTILMRYRGSIIDSQFPCPSGNTLTQNSTATSYIDIAGIRAGEENAYKAQYGSLSDDYELAVYADVTSLSGEVIVDYWLFYYYDDFFGFDHEGDWENIRVSIPASSVRGALAADPTHAWYSQHLCSGRNVLGRLVRKDWAKIEHFGTHPVAYVSRGSHANYFDNGVFGLHSLPPCVAEDHTFTDIQLTPSVVPIDCDTPSEDQAWLNFDGRWGEKESNRVAGLVNQPPKGPCS